jgi:hypothetical protein
MYCFFYHYFLKLILYFRWTNEEQDAVYKWMSLEKYLAIKQDINNSTNKARRINWSEAPRLEGRLPVDIKDL